MIAVPSPVNLCALTIIPSASLYMTLAHEYAVKCLKGAQSQPQPKPQPQPIPRCSLYPYFSFPGMWMDSLMNMWCTTKPSGRVRLEQIG